MSSTKQLYLCNLIPLWLIDDESLDADWVVEETQNGEIDAVETEGGRYES